MQRQGVSSEIIKNVCHTVIIYQFNFVTPTQFAHIAKQFVSTVQ